MAKFTPAGCIGLSYLLTIGSLVAIIFVGIGSTIKDSSTAREIFFIRADLSNVSSTESTSFSDQLLNFTSNVIDGNVASKELAAALEKAEELSELRDFYDIGLLSYCAGDTKDSVFSVDFCSSPRAGFWFNPVEIWHLNGTGMTDLLPPRLQNQLQTYQRLSYWMFIAYALGFAATCIELLIGLTATFSRLGSIVTTVVSVVSSIFLLAAAITSTSLFVILVGVINTSLGPYGIRAYLGWRILVASWFSVVLSNASMALWLFSSSCWPGRTEHRHAANKGNYEQVSPTGVGAYRDPKVSNRSSGPSITAYEPYRHE